MYLHVTFSALDKSTFFPSPGDTLLPDLLLAITDPSLVVVPAVDTEATFNTVATFEGVAETIGLDTALASLLKNILASFCEGPSLALSTNHK
jgi:hypothetical protein